MKILKKILAVSSLALVLGLLAYPAFAQVDGHLTEPQTMQQAADDAMFALQLKHAGQWVALSLVVSQLLIFAVKKFDDSGVNPKMKKYGSVFVAAMSAVAAVLSAKVGGLSWASALVVFVTTGLPKFLQDMGHELGVIPHAADVAPVVPPPTQPGGTA